MANTVQITQETEEAIERLLSDARRSAKDFPQSMHKGRLLDEIDDDVDLVRAQLDMEL